MAQSKSQAKNTHFISADAEWLPFADAAFGLVLSTSTLQWLNSLDLAFAEALRVLAPGGLFCFAMFGEKTLFELRGFLPPGTDCFRYVWGMTVPMVFSRQKMLRKHWFGPASYVPFLAAKCFLTPMKMFLRFSVP